MKYFPCCPLRMILKKKFMVAVSSTFRKISKSASISATDSSKYSRQFYPQSLSIVQRDHSMASLTNDNTKNEKRLLRSCREGSFSAFGAARRRPTAKVNAKSWYTKAFHQLRESFRRRVSAIETCCICYDETKEKQACVLMRKTARGMEQCCSHKDYSICKSCIEQVVATAVNKGVHMKAFCPFCREEFSSAAVCTKGPAEGLPPQISLEVHAYGKVNVSQAINTAAARLPSKSHHRSSTVCRRKKRRNCTIPFFTYP